MSQSRILIVEDDPLTTKLLVDVLTHEGYAIVGPARTLAKGKALADAELGAAVLDFNLGYGETAESLAWMLHLMGVPLIVFTGTANKAKGTVPKAARLIEKGRGYREVMEAVEEACASCIEQH